MATMDVSSPIVTRIWASGVAFLNGRRKRRYETAPMTAQAARAGIAAAKKFMPCWSCNSQKI